MAGEMDFKSRFIARPKQAECRFSHAYTPEEERWKRPG